MNCLVPRKRFKNKHPVWSDPSEGKQDEEIHADEPEDKKPASASDDGDSDSDEDDVEAVAGDVRSKKYRLETKELIFKHLTHLNNEKSFNGPVKQVQFHPKSKIALVALARSQLDLFEVDGERNRYIQKIRLTHTRNPFCSFKPDGDSILMASESYKGNFYSYDMISGQTKTYTLRVGRDLKPFTDFQVHGDFMTCRKEGSHEVFVLSSKTYETVFTLKLNEPAKAIQFYGDKQIMIAGENAKIYVWDLRRTSLCKHKFQDEGTVHATSLTLSNSSKLLSVGSDCGIVNSYDLELCLSEKFPKPSRTYSNLCTKIDTLRYNHSGELLLMGSEEAQSAFRMVHSYSGTVYKNFPPQSKTYSHLTSADFSPLSGYLALGCTNGRAYLCRIPYYRSY